MGLSDYDVASTLATVISQRLVRKLCPKCKKERLFTEKEKQIITSIGERYGVEYDLSGTTYDAIGCKYCNNTGFFDRIGVFEILNVTEKIQAEIMNGKSSIEIRQQALKEGYKPLVVDGLNKVVQGLTTLEELNKKLLIY